VVKDVAIHSWFSICLGCDPELLAYVGMEIVDGATEQEKLGYSLSGW
jgi:hypothetical protein